MMRTLRENFFWLLTPDFCILFFMNILLVNPWITDFAAYDLWAKPLGLLYVGAFLKERGHNVRLVDCMNRFQGGHGYIGGEMRPYGTGKFHREIIPKPDCFSNIPRYYCRYGIPVDLFRKLAGNCTAPDVILVTCIMTYWYPGAFEAISLLRTHFPGTPIALGGVYATLCQEHAREKSGADSVIASSLPSEIIQAVEALGGKQGEGPIPNNNFDQWPEPLWELYDRLPSAVIQTSRGCPMRCTMCASHILWPDFEHRDPSKAAGSIRNLALRKDCEDIAFYDDALLIDSEQYALPFFKELADSGSRVRLHTPNGLHVREITSELAHQMKRAGITTIRLSLETSSDRSANERFSGKVSRYWFKNAVLALFREGFSPGDLGAYVLIGLPGQEKEEVFDTIVFSHSCGVKVKPALYSPVPGTVEFKRAVGSGMLLENCDPLLHNNSLRTQDLWGKGEYAKFKKRVTEGNERIFHEKFGG
jgi:tRNA A37 methylthiotransferase MiaB